MGIFDTNIERKKRKEYRRMERKNIRKEKRELSRLKKKHRKTVLAHNWNSFKKSFISFIKNPFPKKTISNSNQIRKEAFREARNQMIQEWFVGMPKRAKNSINYYFNRKRFQWEFIHARSIEFRENTEVVFSSKILKNNLSIMLLNSTLAFFLSFIVLYTFNNLATILAASFFDIPAELFQAKIYWPLSTYSSLYHRGALSLIFGSGPLVMLIAALLIFFLIIRRSRKSLFIKLFSLWSFIHAINYFLGAYIIGVITRTGFVYATEWIFMNSGITVLEIVFVSAFIIILILQGRIIQQKFLSISPFPDIVLKQFRLWYILYTVIFPWIIGGLLIIAYGIPNLKIEYILSPIFIGIMVLPVLLGYKSPKLDDIRVKEILIAKKTNIITVTLTVIFSLLTYFTLSNGILFNS